VILWDYTFRLKAKPRGLGGASPEATGMRWVASELGDEIRGFRSCMNESRGFRLQAEGL